MFYGIDTESILRHILELRLVRLSATNIHAEATSGLARDIPDSIYRVTDEDSELWTAYNDWKWAFRRSVAQSWAMYNVMLAWDKGGYYERLAIGQLEQRAWGSCSPMEERVRLV